MKQCSQCKEIKELANFGTRKASKDGLTAACTYCISSLRKCQYNSNPEKHKTRVSDYKMRNLDMVKAKGREHSKKRREENPEYFKEYYKNNKEKWAYKPSEVVKKRAKLYAQKHKNERKQYLKEYNQVNKDKLSLNKSIYKKLNSGKFAAMNANRRAGRIKATIGSFKDILQIIYQTTEGVSQFFHVDHIIPLKHPDVCGLHVPWNLQILPKEDNLLKSNQFDGTKENESWRLN